MNQIRHFPSLVLLAAVALFAGSEAGAQAQRSGGGEAAKFMQQYQQMAAEKTALQSQLEQMKKDLDAKKAELDSVKKELSLAKAHGGESAAVLAQAASVKESAAREVEQSKQRMNELVGKYRELAANLKVVESDRTGLRKDLAERSAAYDQCALKNAQLYDISSDVLNRFEHVGPFTKATAAEPFTRLTRTRIENLVDEYRARADELRVKKPAP